MDLTLTGLQIQYLYDFCGGDFDTEITVGRREASTDVETGEPMPAGLWAWFTEYPEEGCIFLPTDAESAAPKVTP